MNTLNIADAVKSYLVDLACKDKLPMDIGELDIFTIETIIKKQIKKDTPKVKKVKTSLEKFLRSKAKDLKSDFNDVPMWVVIASNEFIEASKPTERDKMIEKASHLLSASDDDELVEMIKLIAENEDENEIIDYIDGVTAWEKVEYSFTCEQFCFEIGFSNAFYDKK